MTIGYVITYGYLFGCFFILSVFRYYFNLKTEYTRKIMHFLTGLTWFIINHYYFHTIHMIIIPITFVIINVLSFRFSLFKIVERTTDNHFGTIYYAVGITVLQILNYFNPHFINASSLAVIILAFGDGSASFFGSLFHNHNFKLLLNKSIIGFISFILFSSIGCFFYLKYYKLEINLEIIMIVVLTGGILELLTGKGLDNISILFGITTLAYLLI